MLRNSLRRATTVGVAVTMIVTPMLSLLTPSIASASSHREAPLISQDAQADGTDLYAFVSPDNSDTVTFVANYLPVQVPSAGPNYYKFGDEVLYEINIDNNGDAKDDMSFQFKFNSEIKNGNTFLYNTGPITALNSPNLNQRQFYSVWWAKGHQNYNGTMVKGANKLQVAPAYVGAKSFPEGYGKVAQQAVHSIGDGIKVFAGPREDPFFVDLGGIFDLLSGISGKEHLAGANVMTIALQVPKKLLAANGKIPTDDKDTNSIIGVRTTAYRKSPSVLREVKDSKGKMMTKKEDGKWTQVSRLDNPLVNEVVIPLKNKDKWNASQPKDDGQFLSSVTNPELGGLMKGILGVNTPPAPRNDLVTIFLTGIPGLNQPAKVTPSSQLRLNMAVPVTAEPKKNGVLAGDNQGYPNGRRLADDVTDISLQAVAGGTPFTPDFNIAPNNAIGDKVDANDKPFMTVFPYVAEPNAYTPAPAPAAGQ